MGANSEPLIRVRNLSKVYTQDADTFVYALDSIHLEIEAGDYVAIMGPSGSGKSTLMQILGLLDRPSSGEYTLGGRDTMRLNDEELAGLRSSEIGFIFQFFNLLPRTTCLDNVALPMLYGGRDGSTARAKELLETVHLGQRLNHRPHQLSGGQQQRVAIARALANEPRILFADEPTGNINSEQAAEVMGILDRLNKSGVTIVLVTHEPEIAAHARRILTIKDGKVAKDERLKPRIVPPAETPTIEAATRTFAKRDFFQIVRENTRMAIGALALNRVRTALATLGIVIGIASFVAMIAIGEGAQRAISAQLSALGTNILNVRPVGSGRSVAANVSQRKFTLDDHAAVNALVAEAEADGAVKGVDAKVYGEVVAVAGAKNMLSEVEGALPVSEKIQNNTPVVGRYFTERENETKARVALLGQTVARELFGEDVNPVGANIKLNRLDFTVIGVLPAKGSTTFKDRDNIVLVPLYTAMYRLLGKRKVQFLTVEVAAPERMEEATAEISDVLRRQRRIPEHRENDFEVRNMNEIQEIYNRTTSIISSMLAAIAAVSLLVGGIGIMNVMLVAVKERTREIGLRKALGAKRNFILLQFLIESALIGVIGGGAGVVGGYLLSFAAGFFFAWPVVVPVTAVALAVGFSVAIGLGFGLWPARQAADLSPIEALRYE